MGKQRRPEQELQQSIMQLLGIIYQAAVAFHVPNGGWRSPIEAGIMKKMGVKSGVPDILIARPHGRMGWIEVKAPGSGRLSDNQKAVHEQLRKLGHSVHTVDGVQRVVELVEDWKREDRSHADAMRCC